MRKSFWIIVIFVNQGRIKKYISGVMLIFLISLSSFAGAANLKTDIIGKWLKDGTAPKGLEAFGSTTINSIEFLKDGTVVFVRTVDGVYTYSSVGNYKFIGNNRLKVEFPAETEMFEISIDKERILTLKDPTGNVFKMIPEAIAKKADAAKPYFDQGVEHQKLDQYDRAIEDYNKAISLYPTYVAYNNRGFCYFKMGQYDRAIEDYNKAISLDPTYVAYNNRGFCYFKLGQYDRAIKDYNKRLLQKSLRNPFKPYLHIVSQFKNHLLCKLKR